MAPRKKISTSIRFEVFKRDSFTCQYCGRAAPDVVLELEHIQPHSKGGADDIMNLLTACAPCNNGKGARELGDNAVIRKQRDQIADLQERREQLEMMLRWREGVTDIKGRELSAASDAYHRRAPGWSLNEKGVREMRALITKHGLQAVLVAIDRAADAYIRMDGDKATSDSVDHTWRMIQIFAQPEDVQILYRCRGIIRKRFTHCNDTKAMSLLRRAKKAGAPNETLLEIATDHDTRTWTDWNGAMDQLIDCWEGR